MKLEIKPTERGFLRADFQDDLQYNCSIQESGLKDEKCLWLGINEGVHTENGKPINHQEFTDLGIDCFSRMHLTQEMAGEIAKQLAYFAENGRLKNKEDLIPYAINYIAKNGYKSYLGLIYVEIKEAKEKQILALAEKEFIKVMIEKDLKVYDLAYTALTDEVIVTLSNAPRWKQIRKWLSEGQSGFYTPNGLMKEL